MLGYEGPGVPWMMMKKAREPGEYSSFERSRRMLIDGHDRLRALPRQQHGAGDARGQVPKGRDHFRDGQNGRGRWVCFPGYSLDSLDSSLDCSC